MSTDDNERVKRYCPKCGAGVKAPVELFQRPQKCPKCSEIVQFRDYPSEDTVVPDEIVPDHSPLPKRILILLACLFSLVVSTTVGLILFGNFAGGAILGLLSLLFAIPAVGFFIDQRRRLDEAMEEIRVMRPQIDSYRSRARELEGMYEGFRRNFDALIADERSRLHDIWRTKISDASGELEKVQQMRSAVDTLAAKYLKDSVGWITSKLTTKNFSKSHDRLLKVIAYVRKVGFTVTSQQEAELTAELKNAYEEAVRKELARQEQAEIREKIREEQRAERELQKEMQRIENERMAVERALAEALRRTHDEHSAEVELLRQKLTEAEERACLAQSMAQITKAGHVYVISNFGSFGEGVFKIGMTRRLEPLDRVKELGDASVPFLFDVHMMISCDDAPSREAALHRELHRFRVNKVNLRKEYFRIDIETIREIVERNHGTVDYVADPDALEWRESLTMTEEDYEFISTQQAEFEALDDDE
jgi:hypothetical protein